MFAGVQRRMVSRARERDAILRRSSWSRNDRWRLLCAVHDGDEWRRGYLLPGGRLRHYGVVLGLGVPTQYVPVAYAIVRGEGMSLPVPYYEEPGIVIYHSDCRDILPHLPKVDLVLTDPPYGIGKDGQKPSDGKHGGRKAYPFLGWDGERPSEFMMSLLDRKSTRL